MNVYKKDKHDQIDHQKIIAIVYKPKTGLFRNQFSREEYGKTATNQKNKGLRRK